MQHRNGIDNDWSESRQAGGCGWATDSDYFSNLYWTCIFQGEQQKIQNPLKWINRIYINPFPKDFFEKNDHSIKKNMSINVFSYLLFFINIKKIKISINEWEYFRINSLNYSMITAMQNIYKKTIDYINKDQILTKDLDIEES